MIQHEQIPKNQLPRQLFINEELNFLQYCHCNQFRISLKSIQNQKPTTVFHQIKLDFITYFYFTWGNYRFQFIKYRIKYLLNSS